METLELLLKLWPLLCAMSFAAWWAISNHFIQKSRIDLLEKELENTTKIVDHITESGMSLKKEQEIIKISFGRMEANMEYLMKGIDELKKALESKK